VLCARDICRRRGARISQAAGHLERPPRLPRSFVKKAAYRRTEVAWICSARRKIQLAAHWRLDVNPSVDAWRSSVPSNLAVICAAHQWLARRFPAAVANPAAIHLQVHRRASAKPIFPNRSLIVRKLGGLDCRLSREDRKCTGPHFQSPRSHSERQPRNFASNRISPAAQRATSSRFPICCRAMNV